MSSKILPCGDGSCWKTFKPIASLIAKGKLKERRAREVRGKYGVSVSARPDVWIEEVPCCSIREAQWIPIALMVRFGVSSKEYG
ncbi:hypothetical protein Tco_0705231 [Tanacetum coccineum]|uniref:Uncharacterized protein n=1 Tax=Tanacetum coccineum TaxID=301880 RepID=A0ABQ4Y402_9ASTR